ncbi:MAG: type II toxin-antitoxin system RelE/ParE family toxin [Alphaproteobacteria bacterium]|nr:type II toxin-antitoxin system RelE/ParE family toxin [Alphaproteobacteria bacterium]
MPRVQKTVRAENDLEELWLYIASDNLQAADWVLDDIEAQCCLIATQPGMGRLRPELAPNLRSFPVGRYIILYQTLPDGIEIVRVLHSARDLDVLL